MFKLLLKKILNNVYLYKIRESISKIFYDYIVSYFKKYDLSKENIAHLQNMAVLISSYALVSILIYPEFKFVVFIKEIFSLICVYGAIFLWFVEKISLDSRCKIVVGVTACTAPVIFVNNPFSISIVVILLMIFLEFLIFEYVRGCKLFSDLMPVYFISDSSEAPHFIKKLYEKYKVLEFINLKNDRKSGFVFSSLSSLDSIKNHLLKINKIPFFPFPRRILYFSHLLNSDVLARLADISTEFSIPVFKISDGLNSDFEISHVNIHDFEKINISTQEKSALTSAFKNKRVWIFFDGRQSVLDLISAICTVNTVDLTIFCETEKLLHEINNELYGKNPNKNYKTKVGDIDLLKLQESAPDILFYNIPIRSIESSEDNLKEALVRNVLDTNRVIEFAQNSKIRFVFVLSTIEAMNASNWIGATQRLGEFIAQSSDSKSKKLHTKFRVIRLPECITDKNSVFGDITSSILLGGHVKLNFSDSMKFYNREDILHPLIKLVVFALKEHDFSSSVYTIVPKNHICLDDTVKMICNNFGLRKDEDIKISYNNKLENMDLESFPNISEAFEKTDIDSVVATRFLSKNLDVSDADLWDIDQIKEMKTRDLIASVFQNLNEKIKKVTYFF